MTGVRQSLLVEGMPPFVGCRQKTRQGLTGHNPGGEPEIVGTQRDRERMGRLRHAGDRSIPSPLLKQLIAETLLLRRAEIPAQPTRAGRGLNLIEQFG